MRKIVLILGILAWFGSSEVSAAPESLSFVGQLSTAAGPVDGSVRITFTVFGQQAGGISLWTDTVDVEANAGRVAATLGGSSNPLGESVFDGGAKFLEVVVMGEVLTPRLLINSVPYSIRSNRADSATRAEIADKLADSNMTVQRRTASNMACPAGTFMQTIAPNGDVTCAHTLVCARINSIATTNVSTVNCPAGSIAMGGGCVGSGAITLQDSYPVGPNGTGGWLCRAAGTVQAFAVCCNY